MLLITQLPIGMSVGLLQRLVLVGGGILCILIYLFVIDTLAAVRQHLLSC